MREASLLNRPAGFALPILALFAAAEEGEHAAETFLGLPLWIWQLANLVLFLGVLLYFVARPLAAAFRARQVEVEERLKEAEKRRADAGRLEAEIRDRMTRLDSEILEIRARGVADGETEKAELITRADRDAERVRREAEEEIGRRLDAAKDELRRAAADLTSAAARDLVASQITEDDRRRLLEESVGKMGERA